MESHEARAVLGYRRGTNRFGIRNHIVVVPTVFCTNALAIRVADHFKDRRFGDIQENRADRKSVV